MDGVGSLRGDNVIVVGATNRPEAVDRALLRPGRFDQVVYAPLPVEDARRQVTPSPPPCRFIYFLMHHLQSSQRLRFGVGYVLALVGVRYLLVSKAPPTKLAASAFRWRVRYCRAATMTCVAVLFPSCYLVRVKVGWRHGFFSGSSFVFCTYRTTYYSTEKNARSESYSSG